MDTFTLTLSLAELKLLHELLNSPTINAPLHVARVMIPLVDRVNAMTPKDAPKRE
jgi:hypothetical protein